FFSTASRPIGIYSLSLHDALPILGQVGIDARALQRFFQFPGRAADFAARAHDTAAQQSYERIVRREFASGIGAILVGLGQEFGRSEEHTSELQSLRHLVCRLLLEK